jgi:UDP-N-acetylglucosamine acyltransferase
MLVEGNPARVRSLNLVGLKRAGINGESLGDLKKAFRMLYHSDYTFNQAVEQLHRISDHEQVQHLRLFLERSQLPGRRGSISGRRFHHSQDTEKFGV